MKEINFQFAQLLRVFADAMESGNYRPVQLSLNGQVLMELEGTGESILTFRYAHVAKKTEP